LETSTTTASDCSLELGVAVLVGLHDLGVGAERGVVDEDPSVDLGQIDRALERRAVRLERAHDVVPVQPEIESEVVARPRRDAHVAKAMRSGHGGDERLGAVASRHAEHVGPVGHGLLGQGSKIRARRQLDGLDAALRRLVEQPEALGLAAARLGVDDEDAPPRRRHSAPRARRFAERVPGARAERPQEQPDGDERDDAARPEGEHEGDADHAGGRRDHAQPAHQPAQRRRHPGRAGGEGEEEQRKDEPARIAEQRGHRDRDHRRKGEEGSSGR
jgi:hypothetical protein